MVTHQDRLLRFGTEVIIINASEDSSFEDDLANDALEIVTVFSARLYGSRSHKNRQVMDELTKAAKQVVPCCPEPAGRRRPQRSKAPSRSHRSPRQRPGTWSPRRRSFCDYASVATKIEASKSGSFAPGEE